MITFIIRVAGSFIFLGLAIYIHQYLPNSEFYNKLVIALIAFFVAEGPIYGIQKSSDRIDEDEPRLAVVIFSIVAQGIAVLFGVAYLVLACKHIS